MLGGVDTQFFHAPLTFHPLLREDFWVVQLCGIKLNGQLVNDACASGNCSVIFDSGTSWISGPNSLLGDVQRATVPNLYCSGLAAMPRLSFDLCTNEYELTAEDYSNMPYIEVLDETLCQSGIDAYSGSAGNPLLENTVILGDSFLRKFFIQHDIKNRRVGLAVAKDLARSEYVV